MKAANVKMKRLLIPVFISLVIAGCGSSPPAKPTTDRCLALHTMGLPECSPPTSLPAATPTTVATSHPPMPSHTPTPKEVIDYQAIGGEEDNHLFMDTVFRIAFYVFFGILIVMQVYFAYRIRQSREQVGSDVITDNKLRMSHKATFRFALFITTYQIFLMIWAGYNIWAGNMSLVLGIVFIIGAFVVVQKPLELIKKHRPISVNSSINLSMQLNLVNGVTPELITEILGQESVIRAIQNDLAKTRQIGYKEIWRLGLITPDQDKFDLSLYQLSRQERLKKAPEFNTLMTFSDKIPLKRAAVLHHPYYFNILNRILIIRGTTAPLVRGYPRWTTYGLITKMARGCFRSIREIEIDTNSASTRNRSRALPKFLQEDGFPLKESYVDGDPLTTERGGTIAIDKGELVVIYPKYFVQRRLIDDDGNLIYLGLDEDFGLGPSWFAVSMLPSLSKRLVKCISYNELVPIVRYRSFPYESDFMLPILDTPMSSNGWADLFIDPRGKAKLFVAKERSLDEWYEMMERLRQLFFSELAKKDYHLLGLTKDRASLNHYLSQKQEILKDYYIIQDWELPSAVGSCDDRSQNKEGIMGKKDKNYMPTLPESDSPSLAPQSSPQDATAWQDEAQRLAAQGQWENAIPCLDHAIDLDPQRASAWYNKARCLGALGRLEEAISCYGQALTIDPQMAAAWFSKALAEERIGREQDAADSYLRFIAVSPAEDAEQIAIVQGQLCELESCRESKADLVASRDFVEYASTHQPSRRDAAAWLSEGRRLSGLKRHKEALVAYDWALALDPQSAEVWKLRGSVLITLKRLDEAITSLERALIIKPQDIETWYIKALVLTMLGRTKQLLACWDQVLAINPQDTAAWSNKGNCLVALGRMEKALACFERASGMSSEDTVAWSSKGRCLAELGRREEAIACFNQVQALNPQGPIVWYNLGAILAAVGQPEEAIPWFDRALARNQKHVDAWRAKGRCLATLGRHEESIVCYDRALALRPQDAAAWHHKGIALAALHRREEAIDSYDEVLALNPQDAIALTNKGVDLVDLGRQEEALVCLDRALALNPQIAEAWNAKGACFAFLGRREAAIDCYNRALAIAPDVAETWHNKGLCLADLGRIEEAVDSYDQALALNPQDSSGWERKGYWLIELERWEEAVVCYDQALALNPQNAAAWRNKGGCLTVLNRWEEALVCFDRVLDINPENAVAWNDKVPCLVELGRFNEALTCIKRALALVPETADTLTPPTQIAEKAGRAAEAVRSYERLISEPGGRSESKAEILTPSESVSSVSTPQHPRQCSSMTPKAQQDGDGSVTEMIAYYDRPLLVFSRRQDVEVVAGEASIHALLGHHEEAITGFDQLLSANPRDADLWCNKALSLTTLGRYEEAVVCCDHALALAPHFSAALANKGVSLANLGQWEEALTCFAQMLTHNAGDAGAWNNKGIILAALGRVEEALACYDRALSLAPKNAKAWFNRAIVEEAEGRARDAVHSYKRFLALASAKDTTWIEYAQGRIGDLETQ